MTSERQHFPSDAAASTIFNCRSVGGIGFNERGAAAAADGLTTCNIALILSLFMGLSVGLMYLLYRAGYDI